MVSLHGKGEGNLSASSILSEDERGRNKKLARVDWEKTGEQDLLKMFVGELKLARIRHMDSQCGPVETSIESLEHIFASGKSPAERLCVPAKRAKRQSSRPNKQFTQ